MDLDLGQPPSSQFRMIPRRKEVQSWHDRAPIAPRSGQDQATIGVLRRMPSAVRWSDRDEDPTRQIIPRDASNREGSRPSTPHPTPVKKTIQ